MDELASVLGSEQKYEQVTSSKLVKLVAGLFGYVWH